MRLDPTSPEGLACLLRTFANPIRLRILSLLVESREVCECHLPTALELPKGLITQSISRPKKNGLLLTRREGKWVYIRAAHSASNLYRSLMGCFGARLADATIFEADRNRLKALSPCERPQLPTIRNRNRLRERQPMVIPEEHATRAPHDMNLRGNFDSD